jgi:hypothetical protein
LTLLEIFKEAAASAVVDEGITVEQLNVHVSIAVMGMMGLFFVEKGIPSFWPTTPLIFPRVS